MENEMKNNTNYIAEVIKNSQFNFSLNDWPAAVTLIGVGACFSAVTLYAIKTYRDLNPK
ncbi:MAG: hypothetical protein LHW64_08890 [Candidatus Cloacimonetes bacterium]|nr:hypothetical protein [Candidatus Cloacimonadota bacterium]MDY0230230.1 hypothetical protein [Candidatus Cloacimonadaceae bacterium]